MKTSITSVCYPWQLNRTALASYMKNNEDTVMTEYKGSVPYHKNDNVNPLPKGFKHAQPYLKNLWLGYPFMYEYHEMKRVATPTPLTTL